MHSILIIDDETKIRTLLARILELEGLYPLCILYWRNKVVHLIENQ